MPAWLICVALTAAEPATAASVRSGPAISAEPDEIVVTGERVPRTLRETASSVAVVSADQIETRAASDRIEELLAFIPNVQLGSGGEGPTIRGQDTTGALRDLPAFLGGTRPRTTLVVDGRAVSFHEFVFGIAPLWDIERVEVFRTPQTTTQGRNSIAGAIFVHSKDPTATWEGRVRGIVGQSRTRQLSASLSGPLLDDDLAFRLSGDWRRNRPASDIADTIRGADLEKDEYGLLRAKLVARPAAMAGSRFELTYAHSESHMPGAETVRPPFKKRRNPLGGAAVFGTNVDSLTAAIDYAPNAVLASRTVLSVGKTRVRRFATPGVGESWIRVKDWSAETVADWKPIASVRLTLGASYIRAALDQRIDLSVLAGIGEFDDAQRSFGIFGEAAWRIIPRAELTAGLRYQTDRQQRVGHLGTKVGSIPLDFDRSFDAWLPKLSLTYEFSDQLLAGLLVQRAYNPGGVSLRFDTGLPDEFGAERLWNHELFVRASLGPAVDVRVNVFRTDFRNAQRSLPIIIVAPGGVPVGFADLFNVARARSHGAEAEVDWRVTPRLSARAAIGLLDTKISDPGKAAAELKGNSFQRSPKMTLSASIDWRPTDASSLSAQLRRNGSYFSDDRNSPALQIDGSTIVNARASWRTGRVTLFGYARNLLDKFYLTFQSTPTLGNAGDPRELGLGLEMQF